MVSYDLEALLTVARKGYDFKKHSFGSHLFFAAFNDGELIRKLTKQELRETGDFLKKIRDEDFRGSLYSTVNSLLLLESKVSLPSLDSGLFEIFETEYEMLKHLSCDRNLTGLKFDSSETNKNINAIRKSPKNNHIRTKSVNKEIDMYFLDGKDNGFNGYLMLRKKADLSIITKFMLEYKELYAPSVETLEQADFKVSKKNFKVMQREYRKVALNLLRGGIQSGNDVYDYFEKIFQGDNKQAESIGKTLLSLFFVDYVGGKICSDKETIMRLDTHLKQDLGDQLKLIQYRSRDYLEQGVKDESIVHAFQGNLERSFSELRFQPISFHYRAELGEKAHYLYKEKQKQELLEFLDEYPIMTTPFCNLCWAFEVQPKTVLGENYNYTTPKVKKIIKEYDF